MLGLLGSKSASPHFCDWETFHFDILNHMSKKKWNDMRWDGVRCNVWTEKLMNPKSLYTFSLGITGHSSQQNIHQVSECISPSQIVLLPGTTVSFLIWHSHVIHCFKYLWKSSFRERAVCPCGVLPLLYLEAISMLRPLPLTRVMLLVHLCPD